MVVGPKVIDKIKYTLNNDSMVAQDNHQKSEKEKMRNKHNLEKCICKEQPCSQLYVYFTCASIASGGN